MTWWKALWSEWRKSLRTVKNEMGEMGESQLLLSELNNVLLYLFTFPIPWHICNDTKSNVRPTISISLILFCILTLKTFPTQIKGGHFSFDSVYTLFFVWTILKKQKTKNKLYNQVWMASSRLWHNLLWNNTDICCSKQV